MAKVIVERRRKKITIANHHRITMAVKEWFRKLQPVQIYLVLFFTTAFVIVELIVSHFTHGLTLLVNTYYMLCNIIALIGCIASIKYSNRENSNDEEENSAVAISGKNSTGSVPSLSAKVKHESRSEQRLKNTFGWARINILTMLVCCVCLGSFCFSELVESVQTLLHIDHLDALHQPLTVFGIGAVGILLNAFCYIMIGGYTFYHGSSLQVTKNGDVIMKKKIAPASIPAGEQRLASSETRNCTPAIRFPGRPGFRGIFRDVLGCVFVMIDSLAVYYTDPYVGKFIDPIIAIVSSTSLLFLSYPYMKASGLILLQTIPNHIDIKSLKKELLEAFPGIVNVHDLHVWQLTGDKIISTAHIIFIDPTMYACIRHEVTEFFVEMGITQVTIQPEFQKVKPEVKKIDCLIKCRGENCSLSQCCSKDISLDSDSGHPTSTNRQGIHRRFEMEKIVPDSQPISLKRFTPHTAEYSCESSQTVVIRNEADSANVEKISEDITNTSKAVVEKETCNVDIEDTMVLQSVSENCTSGFA
ncbi:zinc transporter 1 isoform X2 [Neodiprion lecontei]|uniref:Zinc transporter 1 isoform X2 n=1 Tax=Neodiprion lecontei TaxID=441921 RepID=A0ABM3GGH4_NEOLC|nr:zinc transporter 1 isoform X2 [Neodiprion lecontei]